MRAGGDNLQARAPRLWGRTIGAVALEAGSDVAAFEYDPAFVNSGIEIAPICRLKSPGGLRACTAIFIDAIRTLVSLPLG